jgi:hypothetical protein
MESVAYLENVGVGSNYDKFVANANKLAAAGRCILVNDCRTSLKSVISDGIVTLGTIAGSAAHDRFRMLTFVGPRLEILGDIEKKLKAVLPKWHHCLVTCDTAEDHTAGRAALKLQFVFVSLVPSEKNDKIPTTVHITRNLMSGEKVRYVCGGGNGCPHREGGEAPDGDSMVEIPGESKDAADALLGMIADEADAEEDAAADRADDVLAEFASEHPKTVLNRGLTTATTM